MNKIISKYSKLSFIASLSILCFACNSVFALTHFEEGKKAFNSGDYYTAESEFYYASKQKPSDVISRYYRAQALIEMMKLREAESEYQKIIGIAPSSSAGKLSKIGLNKLRNYYIQAERESNIDDNGMNLRNKIKAGTLDGIGDNYIEFALLNGKVVHWNPSKMPLKVFFNSEGTKPAFFEQTVTSALNTWLSVIGGKSVEKVSDIEKANILIGASTSFSGISGNADGGYLSGLTSPHFKGNDLDYFEIKLLTVKPDGTTITETEFYNTALHEAGHAMGIMGHSLGEGDVMYSVSNKKQEVKTALSSQDRNTLKLLYRLDPDYSNYDSAKEKPSEKSKVNELVLGTENQRYQNELLEAQEYVKSAPYVSLSWLSLGKANQNQKKYYDAIAAYNQALKIEPSNISGIEGLAESRRDMGDNVNSVFDYKKLVLLKPDNIDYSYNLASLYLKLNNKTEASNAISSLLINNEKAKDNIDIQNILKQLR
jgi:tetratricopeptide (TPR) repeat protein